MNVSHNSARMQKVNDEKTRKSDENQPSLSHSDEETAAKFAATSNADIAARDSREQGVDPESSERSSKETEVVVIYAGGGKALKTGSETIPNRKNVDLTVVEKAVTEGSAPGPSDDARGKTESRPNFSALVSDAQNATISNPIAEDAREDQEIPSVAAGAGAGAASTGNRLPPSAAAGKKAAAAAPVSIPQNAPADAAAIRAQDRSRGPPPAASARGAQPPAGRRERILIATMLTDDPDQYARGARMLIKSIRNRSAIPGEGVDFKVLELDTKPIQNQTLRRLLTEAGWALEAMPRIPPRRGVRTFGRFKDQFSKLNLWNMTQYDRVLYLDSDCLVVGAVDELLAMDLGGRPIWAARDIRRRVWVDGFNMGVFVVRPSATEFARLLRAKDDPAVPYEAQMAEQGFLNAVYRGRWGDIGFRNNANLAAYTDDRPAWLRAAAEGINVIHYTMSKPWACSRLYAPVCRLWRYE